ncbi:GntR family transcriptional regulator [Streptomyces erythrochromogenes]|uniref:GntR family transcriptional regulator n=1 Tax=Streptomyces erythrochromogenes TaxID=285574 RepID=UPI000318555D
MATTVGALARPQLSETAQVLLLQFAFGRYRDQEELPALVAVAAALRIPQQVADTSLDELVAVGVLEPRWQNRHVVRPRTVWPFQVRRPTPAAEAVARRIILDITAHRTPAANELPSPRQLAATYGVNVDVVREGLRLAAMREVVALVPGRPATVIRPLRADSQASAGTASR